MSDPPRTCDVSGGPDRDGAGIYLMQNAVVNEKISPNQPFLPDRSAVVDGGNYAMIDNTFNPQGAALTGEMATSTAEIAALSTTSVPEPASVALLVIGSVAMLGRRRNTIHRHRVMQRMVHHVMDVGAVNNALRVSNPRGSKRLGADGMRHPHAGEDADRFSSP